MEKVRKQIISIIQHSKHILVMPSAPADGDSLGSALALYLAFRKIGKDVTVVSAEPVPDAFQFLPTTNVISGEFAPGRDFIVTLDCEKAKVGAIKTKLEQNKVNIIVTAKKGQFSAEEVSFHHGPGKYDLIITVDTGDLSQLGRFYEDNTELFTAIPVINIDHHASNGHFGRINMVDIMASATTEMLVALIEDLEREVGKTIMDEDIATLLLAGIITDTGSFQNANTTPRSFFTASKLVKYGARQQEIIQHVFKTKRLSTLRLWGRILSNIQVDMKYRLLWATISRKDFEETGSQDDETGGIIDELMTNAPGTEIILILKEKEGGIISGSVRTLSASIDSSVIAQMFGGGGHVQAAGFKIANKNIKTVEENVIKKIKDFQNERLHLFDEVEVMTPIQSVQEIEKTALPELPKGKKQREATVEKTAIPSKSLKTIEKMIDLKPEQHTETFTDVVIRKSTSDEEGKTFDMDQNITYKFED